MSVSPRTSGGGGDVEQAGKEYLGQVVALYESESKTFRTLLSGLLVFGLSFLFLVLVPFVRVHRQHRVIGARLLEIDAESRQVAVGLDAYRAVAQGFDRLRQAVVQGPYELRDALPAILSPARQAPFEINAPVQQMAQQRPPAQEEDPCGSPAAGADWENCRVAAQVRRQFQQYRSMLDADVLAPLQALPDAPAGVDLAALPVALDSLRAAYEARLAANPRFWERFSGKTDFFGQMQGNLDEFWRRYGFEDGRAALEAERARLDSLTAALQQREKALETGEEKLAARLAELDSPLGKLPVGLVEAVQMFPLLVAIGFGWCVLVLRRLVALRRAMQEGYARRDPAMADLTERHLALVAPVWVERGGPALGRSLLWTPIAVFGVACALVAYHWSLDPGSGDVLALDPWVYGTLYVAAAAGLVYALRQAAALVRALRETG